MSSRFVFITMAFVGVLAIILILRQPINSLPSIGGDKLAYTLYLGIWATLIGSAMLSRSESFSNSLKQLVTWITIFLIVIAGYTYRYEIQDIASGMTAGLIPGSPISAINADRRIQVTLIRDVIPKATYSDSWALP